MKFLEQYFQNVCHYYFSLLLLRFEFNDKILFNGKRMFTLINDDDTCI